LFRNISAAAVMALLFALHPLNVDSVSWISARSNLLSTLFFIIALLLYLHYLAKEKPSSLSWSPSRFCYPVIKISWNHVTGYTAPG